MLDINKIYEFGPYQINCARRELRNLGQRIEIEPRVFDLLTFLVQNSGRAVDKNELQDAIWPGMIVTETALTRAVMKARKSVGDNATRQEMIRTIHGHGYRFVAEVVVKDTKTESTEPVDVPVPAGEVIAKKAPTREKPQMHVVVMAVIALLVATSLVWILLRPTPDAGDGIRIAVLPLQDNTGNQDLAWSRFGLMSYANELISNDSAIEVIPAGGIIGLAENFSWNGDLEDPSNQPLLDKLRQVYAATHVLAMELEPEQGALRMNYSLLVPDGDLKMGTMVNDSGTELTYGVVQAVYGNVLRKSHLGGAKPLASKDAFNNEAFARGMDLSLQGRCAEAVQFFRVIIEQEASLFEPRFELAACLRLLGEQDEAELLLTTLVEEQRPLGNSRRLAEALMTLGVLYNRTGRLELSEVPHTEALQVAQEIGDHALAAEVLQNLSILNKNRNDLDEAARLLDLAVLEYQDAGVEILPGYLYSGRANLSMARNELVEADIELGKALKAFQAVGNRHGEAMMLNNTGYLRRLQGMVPEAEAYHLRSLEIREEIGDKVGVGRIYGMLSGVYASQGQHEKAKMAAIDALKIARETNDRLFEATSLAQLATAEVALEDLQSARLHYNESRAIFVAIQDALRILQVDIRIAQLDLDQGQVQQARESALRALEASREQEISTTEVEALEFLGDLELSGGNIPGAITEFTEALERVKETSWDSKLNSLEVKLANAYMDIADLDSAAPLMGALAVETVNVPTLKTQARFSFLRGDVGKAVELMSEAKIMAGDSWSDESETLLSEYRANQQP
jgi:DNA-binding winged helix-turn-helix (wHTH) protein/tetratricopeptide (TPR) repeat protein